MAADLASEAIEMGVLPGLARQVLAELARGVQQPTELPIFLTFHRTAVMLTGYLANGLYTLAVILCVWSTQKIYPAWVSVAGIGVGGAGLTLSKATLLLSVNEMMWANVVLVPCIMAWLLGVALTCAHRGR
jgi:hypothetical protein